jgi:hypothetical protein
VRRRPLAPLLLLALAAASPVLPASAQAGGEAAAFARAAAGARLANEGFVRSRRLMYAWLEHADPATGLLPRTLTGATRDLWNAKDCAADLYPFLVLTASFTDPALYRGRMVDLLLTETALTSRVDRLPDDYSFSKHDFARDTVELSSVLFGASEYVKDGLMPITEWLGETPWSRRMLGLIDDAWRHAPVATPHGPIVSDDPEVGGDQRQVLARAYWLTGEPRYLEYAERLGDYWLLGDHHPTRDRDTLRLRDHGDEVISGLTELYATERRVNPARADAYRAPLHAMLDRILEVGRNRDGLFYNSIAPRAGRPVDDRIADNFGYVLNAYYTVYLLDGTREYRDAVRKALSALDGGYRGFDFEDLGADGDADAVEGALDLYNREPVPSAAAWIDYQTRWMWSKQDSAHRANARQYRGSGIVEGWYGDGNFSRTSLMYALWKTQGTSVRPWRPDVLYGADREGDALRLVLRADSAWSGALVFDVPRHRVNLHLPMDWPRINQFPEWFTVEADRRYEVRDLSTGTRSVHSGAELARGLPVELRPGRERRLVVRPLP